MPRFATSTESGRPLSANHGTALGAIRAARRDCLQLGEITVRSFGDKHDKIGKPVAYIGFDGEWDAQRRPLHFWNDGRPSL